jgi:branched-subunit amino acid aminotransferase/4-amino-4-deoxychorismate lyase
MIYASLNGNILPLEEVKIRAQSRAAYYGDGCFETLRSYQGRFVALDRHIDRLKDGMKYLGIKIPSAFTEHYLAHIIEKLLEQSELIEVDARIRIQVWRNGTPGYQTEIDSRSTFLVTVAPIIQRVQPLTMAVVEQRKIPGNLISSSFKLSNSISYILAERQAKGKKADEALMLTTDGYISEAATANLFWLKKKTVHTPSSDCDILPGITRDLLINLIEQDTDFKIHEGKYTLEDLNSAEAVWITNSIKEMNSVSKINDVMYKIDHPAYQILKKLLKDRIRYLWL